MLTTPEKECIQLFRNAGEATKTFIFVLLLCFAYCGEDFINEIQEAKNRGGAEMKATVEKYVAHLRERVAI